MADKLGIGPERRELKLGASFTNPKSTAFHTVRYDFKPASVDVNKSATIDVGTNNQVTVNVPHLDGAGTSQTVFKGSQKPYQKECVLIFDPITGQITLEKLTSNIQVKKTRSESTHKPLPPHFDKVGHNESSSNHQSTSSSHHHSSSSSSKGGKMSNSQRNRKERHGQSLNNIPKHSPRQPHHSPVEPLPSQTTSYSPARTNHKSNSNSNVGKISVCKNLMASPQQQTFSHAPTLASLPMIGGDDFGLPPPATTIPTIPNRPFSKFASAPEPISTSNSRGGDYNKSAPSIGVLSDSSSSSSSSSDDSESDNESKNLQQSFASLNANTKVSESSDSDSESDHEQRNISKSNISNAVSVPDHVLINEDLCLSESGSDSD